MIEINNVRINYGDFIALEDINFTVNKGEFFTLLGPSGSGKSTMLRAIAGFIQPSQGTISMEGKIINATPVEERGIGMVFQSYALFPSMTVYDNIAFGLKVEKADKQYIDERVHQLAQMVDLNEEQLSKNVSALSGGQQQRVAITRALAKKPEILAMDEPLSNLDARLRKALRVELKNIQKELGVTTLYVTHDQEEALILSNRIAVFSEGRLEQVGTPKEIYDYPETEFVCTFIGDSNKLSKEMIHAVSPNLIAEEGSRYYIRPENIKIRSYSDDRTEDEIVCQFHNEDYYGTHMIYHLLYPDTATKIKMMAFTNKEGQYQQGEKVLMSIDPNKIHVFKGGE